MNIPQIQINQTFAKIGIETQSTRIDIKTGQADLRIKQENEELNINQSRSMVQIDQSRAYSALGQGSVIEVTDTIIDKMYQTGLNAIKNIAAKGETFQDIHLHDNNLIAQFAKTDSVDFSAYQYAGRASCDNVDVNVVSGELEMDWKKGKVEVDIEPNKATVDYTRGNVDIYVKPKNSVEILTPQIDLKL